MKQKKIVIIGANDFQNQLILKAKSIGYETHVFAWKDGAVGEKSADYFYPISIVEKQKILSECKKINPSGVISIASDLAVATVSYVEESLNLVCNKESSVLCCTNKYQMRRKLKSNGIYTPSFIEVNNDSESWLIEGMTFPMIVKPTDRSGSRGITKIGTKAELASAINYSINSSFEKKAIVEEFIEGDEYSCECISYKSKHHFLAFTKKYTTGAPHYIETAHLQPSDINLKYHDKIKEIIFKALDALGIENGASHTEFKINKNGEVGIIEIGARMGGDCIGSDLVQISTGYDFLKMVIDVAVNKEPEFVRMNNPKHAAIKFLFNKNDIRVLDQIKSNHFDMIYRISQIDTSPTNNIIDSSTRLGYYIMFSDMDNIKSYL